jgi:ferrous iron transport protein B
MAGPLPDSRAVPPTVDPPVRSRIALIGNPNTGKTTLFNRLCGLRHKTSNFPGTTQDALVGVVDGAANGAELIDLPGVYSIELAQAESRLIRAVLAGETAPTGETVAPPDAIAVVADATNLVRNLALVGEALRRRLPTVVIVNMADIARRRGLAIDAYRLEEELGCAVILCSARTGEGVARIAPALTSARVPNRTPPGDEPGLIAWAEGVFERSVPDSPAMDDALTDRLDRALTHPFLGVLAFAALMTALFWVLFKLATVPMDLIDSVFSAAADATSTALGSGILSDLLANGVIAGIGATVIFLPQILLLFFLISLLEDTGYLARAAFVMDRVLRPFGLPGHSFVPLLSSHACALPGIMATRAIPDRRERLATILVAPFMTCSARLPVYALLVSVLFPGRPGIQALAFTGCYALGIVAGLLSALLARRTILRGKSRPMALELPSYKWPSVRTATLTAIDRGMVFLKKAGTVILAISIVLWWLGAYPQSAPPQRAVELRAQAAAAESTDINAAELLAHEADLIASQHQSANSFIGRMGRTVEPVLAPLGYDWHLSIGVLASFAAREVFVATMAVVTTGQEDPDADGVLESLATSTRADGVTPIFTPATSWSLLVYYVLAMQCLPTLAVTAREAGGTRWALLQLAWMSAVAYGAALLTFQSLRALGVA